MTLGQRIRQARLEAGLSQRQLAGDTVTRNMLSQIEHDTAHPSMDTLRAFADRLGKSISFFLDENAVTSPNQDIMARARTLYSEGSPADAVNQLSEYRKPDPTFDREKDLLLKLCLLDMAEAAVAEGRLPYAAQLLDQADFSTDYCAAETERRRLLLLAQARPDLVSAAAEALPDLDRELLVRAAACTDPNRAAAILDAAANHADPEWNLLRGEIWFSQGNFSEAAAAFRIAEPRFPRQTVPRLEQCYRELEDFKQAYLYACKQKSPQ